MSVCEPYGPISERVVHGADDGGRQRYTLTLEARIGRESSDVIRALRRLLKYALRACALTCVRCMQGQENGVDVFAENTGNGNASEI